MITKALDENSRIICLGDLNKNFMGQLPNNVNDIFSINGLTNIINKPTHFDSRTGNSSLLDPILITDNVPLIDSDTIHIDRKISDHEGTILSLLLIVTSLFGIHNSEISRKAFVKFVHAMFISRSFCISISQFSAVIFCFINWKSARL
jgi:hypothetical protein